MALERGLGSVLIAMAALASHAAECGETPGPLNGAAAAFDPATSELVLFGGVSSGGAQSESLALTWRWDGSRWRKSGADGPSPRSWPSLTWDPVEQGLILFGGKRDNTEEGIFGDTWRLAGDVWSRLTPAVSPDPRAHHAAAWDSSGNRLVLFGGQSPRGALADAWAWAAGSWKELEGIDGPAARAAHAMYDDPVRGGVVIHGGSANPWPPMNLSDRWLVSGGGLTSLPPAPARALHVAALTAGGVMICCGWGFEAAAVTAPWLETAGGWRRLDDEGAPPPRSGAAWAVDPADGALYLYGGADRDFEPLGDFWRFDGEAWEEIGRGDP